jgi:hypothetical protein
VPNAPGRIKKEWVDIYPGHLKVQACQPLEDRKPVQFTVQIPGQIWVQINTFTINNVMFAISY